VISTRIPIGLTLSMSVAAASLGTLVIFWNLAAPSQRGPALLVHVAAGLCLAWSLLQYAITTGRKPSSFGQHRRDAESVLIIARIVTGLLAVICMVYAGVAEVIVRTLALEYPPPPWCVELWRTGPIDLAAVALAMILGWRRTHINQCVTALFWILILSALWMVFLIMPQLELRPTDVDIRQPTATHWAGLLALWISLIIAGFTVAEGVIRRRWQHGAWPDNLWKLTQPLPPWSGFRYSAGVMGVAILIAGCVYILLPYTFISAFVSGSAILFLAWRRWDDALVEVGLALVTLGIVSLFMIGVPGPPFDTSSALAEVFNRALVGVAITTWFWHWLASVWKQQLDDGRAWTTSGRMVRPAERVGYMMGSGCVLLALHAAFWPKLPGITDLDNTPIRWVWGLGGHLLAMAALISAVARTRKTTLAWLVLFVGISAVGFALLRTPISPVTQISATYWPVVLTIAAMVSVFLAGLSVRHSRWQPFTEPFYLTGILIAPITAIAGIAFSERLKMPPEVPVLAFAGLTCTYALACVFPGPRKLAILAVACGVVCVMHLL